MKKYIIILSAIISLIFTDPFREFDKDFLYSNSLKELSWAEISKNEFQSACMSALNEETDTYDNRKEFCTCTLKELMSIFSEDEFLTFFILIT